MYLCLLIRLKCFSVNQIKYSWVFTKHLTCAVQGQDQEELSLIHHRPGNCYAPSIFLRMSQTLISLPIKLSQAGTIYSQIYSPKCLHYIYVLPHSDKLIILRMRLWTSRIFQIFWYFQNKAGNSFCNSLQHSLQSYLAQINLYHVPKVVVITER